VNFRFALQTRRHPLSPLPVPATLLPLKPSQSDNRAFMGRSPRTGPEPARGSRVSEPAGRPPPAAWWVTVLGGSRGLAAAAAPTAACPAACRPRPLACLLPCACRPAACACLHVRACCLRLPACARVPPALLVLPGGGGGGADRGELDDVAVRVAADDPRRGLPHQHEVLARGHLRHRGAVDPFRRRSLYLLGDSPQYF
jgi:hypothetical protein